MLQSGRISSSGAPVPQQQQSLLAALLGFLNERHIAALQAWPMYGGGGRDGVARLVGAVADLLSIPLVTPAGQCGAARAFQVVCVCDVHLVVLALLCCQDCLLHQCVAWCTPSYM